ncbi:putative metalloprotease CJM1_0395 family protein [Reinekea thalattae]|uniref:Catalase n=1 Tax=Reinekea thalattae TaxID=2593301 RepID=A0A5C8ZB91_9GAMM|nr:putative metalloprotease CJM1_0395 family protein [Reinekea thalattae]TXR54458.1 catalase [Reinekea thalattae]
MSTVSGMFPNAITPTFAASSDPAAETRQRRENENRVFSPVEALSSSSESNATHISQPGRVAAEQSVRVSSQTIADQPQTSTSEEPTEGTQRVESEEVSRVQQSIEQSEMELIDKLSARDQEVRQHEQAHKSVGGQYAGAISLDYTRGPNGQRYATSGEVPIDVAEVPGDPEATISKARTVRAAALAPAEPSEQDRQVASIALKMQIDAQVEMRTETIENAASEPSDEATESSIEFTSLFSSEEIVEDSEADRESESDDSDDAQPEQSAERNDAFFNRAQETAHAIMQAYEAQMRQEVGVNLDTHA